MIVYYITNQGENEKKKSRNQFAKAEIGIYTIPINTSTPSPFIPVRRYQIETLVEVSTVDM